MAAQHSGSSGAPSTTGVGGAHDVGGDEDVIKSTKLVIDTGLNISDKSFAYWEKRTHALEGLLEDKRLFSAHMLRRHIEGLHPTTYESTTYYEKWASAIASSMIEQGIITQKELDDKLGPLSEGEGMTEEVMYKVGQVVRVRPETYRSRWRKPHIRVPGYVYGCVGVVQYICGVTEDATAAAFGLDHVRQPLYRVRFRSDHIWLPGGKRDSKDGHHTVDVEIYQSWLEKATEEDLASAVPPCQSALQPPPSDASGHDHHHDHSDDHCHDDSDHHHHHHHEEDHGHIHEEREEVEKTALQRESEEPPLKLLSDVLCELLISKNVVTASELHRETMKIDDSGMAPKAKKMVARAWVDEEFKKRLLTAPLKTCQEEGYLSEEFDGNGRIFHIVENTPTVHNLIVCTLCSCYPTFILGMSPAWYKSRAYRARAVLFPHQVLKEFGVELDSNVLVQVHDSTADLRYMVLPCRPKNTDGWTAEQLEGLISRDCLLGTGLPVTPE